VGPLFFSLYSGFFAGESKWPEAVGAALVFEGDAYVVRTLIVNSPENKNTAIPFLPLFVSGPALVPQSPDIFPADVDLFASVSLDYPQVYEGMLKAMTQLQERERKYIGQPVKELPPPETLFAAFEKKLGIKIKDDLLPLLGNELALALPRKAKKAANEPATKPSDDKPAAISPQSNPNADPNPIIAIAVKDREAVGRLIPKLIEGFGLKGANLLAQTEKRDGTELVSYAGVFSYAFVGDFLVVSPDPAQTRHVVDAYLEHQTLSSNSHFRNYTRWQSRQVLGQVYMAPGLVETYITGGGGLGAARDDRMSEFLSSVNPVIDPVTYSLSNDGLGPLHELHIPKNLLQLLIAETSSQVDKAPLQANEAIARSALRSMAGSEDAFKSDNAHYGSLDELFAEKLITKDLLENHGYRIELTVSGDKFEATAVPLEYGKTGRLSFFIDESSVLRAGDHGGGAATAADQPLD
jgi:hypothetical protein